MLGKFLSNIYDPKRKDAEREFTRYYKAMFMFNGQKAMKKEWQRHLEWINNNVIGPPQATSTCTQQQLEERGQVGIYASV